jgi:hypothetical protein
VHNNAAGVPKLVDPIHIALERCPDLRMGLK